MIFPVPFSEVEYLPLINIAILEMVFPTINRFSIYQKLKRWNDAGKILNLKKGLYMPYSYFQRHQNDFNFHVFIANHLREPSYVSGAYILQRYDALTEGLSYPITSVTLKSSRSYVNSLGDFVYHSISESLYTGYRIESYNNQNVYVASKSKALFDFFYFKYLNVKDFPPYLKDRERIDLHIFNRSDRKEFKKYCRLSHFQLFKTLPNLLFDE